MAASQRVLPTGSCAVRVAAASMRAHAARSARFGDRRAVVVAPLARSGLKRPASRPPPSPAVPSVFEPARLADHRRTSLHFFLRQLWRFPSRPSYSPIFRTSSSQTPPETTFADSCEFIERDKILLRLSHLHENASLWAREIARATLPLNK